jgi:hypothetical protein
MGIGYRQTRERLERGHELAMPGDVTEYGHADLNMCGLAGAETSRACTIAIEEEDLVTRHLA